MRSFSITDSRTSNLNPPNENTQEAGVIFVSIILAFASSATLYSFSDYLISRAARAFIGLALVFGAICYGAQGEGSNFPFAVLWAGVLFGAVDSLGKIGIRASDTIDPLGQDVVN